MSIADFRRRLSTAIRFTGPGRNCHHVRMTPPIDATERRRPRRAWFGVAALVGAGGLLAAIAVPLLVLGSGGDLGQRMTGGQAVTVHLSSADQKQIWVRENGRDVPDPSCEVSPVDGQELTGFATIRDLFQIPRLEVDGERWRGLLTISAEPPGRYAVTCTGTGGSTLAVGDPPRLNDPRSRTLGTVAAVCLGAVSLVSGVVLAVVVARRRARQAPGRTP